MKRFFKKAGLFSLPFIMLVIIYFISDPFKVLYHYDSYFTEQVNGTVFLNTDYVATSNFDNRYEEEQYNSFIFGNSRAWFYRITDWQEHIGHEPAYHFDAAGETLYALHKKIRYLDRKNVRIKNALVVLDYELLSNIEPKTGHLGMISPQLVENQNWVDFHKTSLLGFFNIQFMYAFIDFRITGKLKPYMFRNNLLETRPFAYNPVRNELSFYYYDALIENNEYYDDQRAEIFFARNEQIVYSPPAIQATQKEMLIDIADIFKKHHTSYRIIISPLYNQEYMDTEDVAYLKTLFGASYVYDFSGINEITNDFTNYYEISHYRPPIARKLMQQVYGSKLHAETEN